MVVLTIGSFIGFAIFLIMIQLGTMQRWEEAFALQIIQSRTPSLTRMMHFFTNLGKAFPTVTIALLLFAFPSSRADLAPKTAVSIFIVSAAAYLIKRIVRRDRPIDHRLVEEKDHSFPSAHAATSAAMYGTIALNLGQLVPSAVIPMTLLAILLSFMIGFSRVYLGIHFLTDVIGGWLLGAGVAGLVTLLMNS
ncbi:phosphatase PAP2 family protein [Enterococcus casseliflavus]|uniref:phosphatase PAP2 family protein n=1 Tax=Enterococcus casseliflavus TaxID=37734 RepID=UPI001D633B96|nr:phosphatase PAP2 family protein [Enterococcus sp.]